MATPIVKTTTVSATINAQSPNVLSFQCNNLDGTALNISSGYTAQASVQSQSTPIKGTVIDLAFAATYGSTGLLTLTMSEADSNLVPCSESMPLQVAISNDSFTTQAVVAQGFLKSNQALQ